MLRDPLAEVQFEHVDALVSEGLAEGDDLEYKADLPDLGPDSAKKELLKDVAAMANAGGGWIIYGVRAGDGESSDKSVPEETVGVRPMNVDQEKIRIMDIVRAGIAPRLDVLLETPEDAEGKRVVVMRVPQAGRPPCIVVYNGEMRFWMRRGARKYPMDVEEVRRTILESETWLERLRAFRLERQIVIQANPPGFPVDLAPFSGRLFIHVAPAGAFRRVVSPTELASVVRAHQPRLVGGGTGSLRANFDGFVAFTKKPDYAVCYVQVFRTGVIETVDCIIFKGQGHLDPDDQSIFEDDFRNCVAAVVEDQVHLLAELGFAPPYAVMVSLIGVKDWFFAHSDPYGSTFPRSDMLFPELLVNADDEVPAAMDELMTMVWQAAGQDSTPETGADIK